MPRTTALAPAQSRSDLRAKAGRTSNPPGRVPRSPRPETALADLNPNKNNPRKIAPEAMDALRRALFEFGDLGGIIYNTSTGRLVGGHQRVEAFRTDREARTVVEKELKVPDRVGTTATGYIEANGTRYSFRKVEWPLEKEEAANLAANRHHGEFDWEIVSDMLKRLEGKMDLSLTGFAEHELNNLLAASWTPPPISPMTPETGEEKMDKVYLSKAARKELDKAKAKLHEPDDSKAILHLAREYNSRTNH